MRVIADSTVLIDMWRLRRTPQRLAGLRPHLTDPVLAWQVVFEFVRGAYFRGMTDFAIRRFLAGYAVLPVTESQVWRAARIDADLNLAGLTIAQGCYPDRNGLPQRRRSALGALLLHHVQTGGNRHDHQDDNGASQIAGRA